MIVVSDTSAITSLMQVRRVEILAQLYQEVVIPTEVAVELERFHTALPEFVQVIRVENRERFHQLQTELDTGEAAAITLMLEGKGDLLLIDERRGRQIAQREGLAIIGIVGVLLEARLRGLIPSLRIALSELEAVAGFRVSSQLKCRVLKAGGEEPL